jgi:hypothetical protein
MRPLPLLIGAAPVAVPGRIVARVGGRFPAWIPVPHDLLLRSMERLGGAPAAQAPVPRHSRSRAKRNRNITTFRADP